MDNLDKNTKIYIIGGIIVLLLILGGFMLGRGSVHNDSIAASQLQTELDGIITNQQTISRELNSLAGKVDGIAKTNSDIQSAIQSSQAGVSASQERIDKSESSIDASKSASDSASAANIGAQNASNNIANLNARSGQIINELQKTIEDVSTQPQGH